MKNRECPDCRGKKTTSLTVGSSRLTQKCYWCDGTGIIKDCVICKGNGSCDSCIFGAVPDVDVDKLKIWVSTTHSSNTQTKELQRRAIEARKGITK